jgi:hypothetical protein
MKAKIKKLITVGWDAPTTAQFRRDIAKLIDTPLDGTLVWARAKGDHFPDRLNLTPMREAFSNIPWKREWFHHAIEDLQVVKQVKTPLTDNFLRVDCNPGDVDWFDDAGWAQIVQHFGISAWIAKQGGLKGLCVDAEPYRKPYYPFDYKMQPNAARYSFEAYQQKARQRGRETMQAMAAEFPDATLFTFFIFAYFVDSNPFTGPSWPQVGLDKQRALFLHTYGLYPAFIEGWFDAIPKTMQLVDGNEHGYAYTKDYEPFAMTDLVKTQGIKLLSNAKNQEKYKKQLQSGHAIYLDSHVDGLLPQYQLSEIGAQALEKHTAAALSASDEYVWLYGEQGQWWPAAGNLEEWPNREVFPPWETRLSGATNALRRAKQRLISRPPVPRGFVLPIPGVPTSPEPPATTPAMLKIAQKKAATLPNLLKNPDFADGPPAGKEALPGASSDWGDAGAPAFWNYWQDEFSTGRFDWDATQKAARASKVKSGVFLQSVEVKPGERFYLEATARVQDTGMAILYVGWKTEGGAKWLPVTTNITAWQPTKLADGREHYALIATAPKEAGILVVQLGISGQPSDRSLLWWKQTRLCKLAS